MVGSTSRLTACAAGVWLASWVAPAAAQEFRIIGHCRDGQPHGAYELRSAAGQLRVLGAFNHGRRTSSFLYWTSKGVRIAHIPFDEDRLSGTLSLWYADASPDREPQPKLQAGYVAGRRTGITRSWYADGTLRAALHYERGELVDAQAWDASGSPLSAAAARELAARDRDEDERYYASLAWLVTSHLPRCDAQPSPSRRADAAPRIAPDRKFHGPESAR
jgi:hypothetical protein